MKKENFLYLLIFLTLLIVRVSVFLIPEVTIKFLGLIIHHFWFGIILIAIGFFISRKKSFPKLLFYSIGIGLFIDQLVFMILGAGTDQQYWALPSLLSAIILLIIIFPFRKKMAEFIL
jgi:hypothetical protein